jgi:hypothetical protein
MWRLDTSRRSSSGAQRPGKIKVRHFSSIGVCRDPSELITSSLLRAVPDGMAQRDIEEVIKRLK